MKYNIPRVPERLASTSFASTAPSSTPTTTIRDDSKGLSLTSEVIIGILASCLGLAILIILGFYFYSRRRNKNAKSPGFVFGEDDFADAKKSASSPEFNEPLTTDLMKLNPYHRRESSSTSTSNDGTVGHQLRDNPFLKVTNVDQDQRMSTPNLTFPKPVAEKSKPLRFKHALLSPITTEAEVRTPPPAYGMSSAGEEISIPIPPQRSTHKSKATPMPPTPPINRKSNASATPSKTLVIPDHEPVPVISPARSESFAPKDLVPPSPSPPASSTSGLDSAGSQIGSSRVEHDTEVKLPRLMSVVALFKPNLPDELHIKIGDTVRIIEEYKDGWCFAQFLGRKDAPKGMVPLACLQERKRLVPLTHKTSNSSVTSINWR